MSNPRGDTLLTRTATSSAQRRQEIQNERLRAKEAQKEQLEPVADLVFDAIDKLKERNRSRLIKLIDPNTPDDNVHAILLGVRFNEQDLELLQTTMKNILRHKKNPSDEVWDV